MITATESLPEIASSRADFSSSAENRLGATATAEVPKTVWSGADLLLLGLVAALAVATFATVRGQLRQRQARVRVTQDLTVAAAAFRSYISQYGSAPPDAGVGTVPQGMASFLIGIDWKAPTPAGGHYRWINANSTPAPDAAATAAPTISALVGGVIAITAFPASPALTLSHADLLAIDRDLDDGNLAAGKFRLGFNGWPVLTVRARPDSP